MTDNTTLMADIEQLFNHRWDDSLTDAENLRLKQLAASLVQDHGWDTVLKTLTEYLHTHCLTPKDVTNAAHLMWRYWWCDTSTWQVPDPYGFLGYLYYRAGFLEASYEARCILDGLTTEILPAQGYQEANIYYHPYYAAETDPKMIAAVNRWKERLSRDEPANTDRAECCHKPARSELM